MFKVFMKISNIRKSVSFLVFDSDLEYGILGLNDCSKFNLNINCVVAQGYFMLT